MKKIGFFVLAVGLVGLIAALGMDTTVASSHGSFERIHNIGLMNDKQNLLLVSVAVAIAGVILLGFGYRNGQWLQSPAKAEINTTQATRTCPFCAEQIMAQAVVCRYCGRDIPSLENNFAIGSRTSAKLHEPIKTIHRRIVATALLAILGGLGAWQILGSSDNSSEFIMEPISVKLTADGNEAYLQAAIVLKLVRSSDKSDVKAFHSEIRHKVTLLLLSKKSSQVADAAGQAALAEEIRTLVNGVIGSESIEQVFFTTFIAV